MNRRRTALLAALLAISTLTACAPATRVVLLPQPDKPTAAIAVQSPSAQVMLTQPYDMAEVRERGTVDTAQSTPRAVQERYGQLLSVQPQAAQNFTLYFMPGGAQLTSESNTELNDILSRATQRPGGEIVVVGHTDRVGSVASNDALSLQRAQVIRQLVIERGFDAARVEAVGRGEREPVIPTADEVDEPKNRRAEIVVR